MAKRTMTDEEGEALLVSSLERTLSSLERLAGAAERLAGAFERMADAYAPPQEKIDEAD